MLFPKIKLVFCIQQMQLIESKIHKIETDIESNKKIVGEIRREIVDIIHGGQDAFKNLQESFEVKILLSEGNV